MDEDVKVESILNQESYSGKLYEITVSVPRANYKRTISLRFPPEYHSDTHGGMMPVTYQELMGMYLKFGKWGPWLAGNLRNTETDIQHLLDLEVEKMYSEAHRKAKSEWISALRRKDSQAILKKAKAEIDKLNRTYKEKRSDVQKLTPPTFFDIMTKKEFYAKKRGMEAEAREARLRVIEKREELKEKKKSIVEKNRSKDTKEQIEYLVSLIREAEDSGSRRAKKLYEEELQSVVEPFSVASNIEQAIKRTAEKLKELVYDLLEGSKSPALSQKTIYNRHSMGITSEIPLNETGEFINSLQVFVI